MIIKVKDMNTFRRQLFSILLLAAAGWMSGAVAQDYPSRPIRILVPVPPGGGTDLYARTVGAKISENIGQPVIIDNRPGGGTFVAVGALTGAAPDGYTLLLSAESTFATNQSLFAKLPYDPAHDFTWVTLTARFHYVIVTRPDFPAGSLAELLATLKSRPGELKYASVGPGSPHHLQTAMFLQRTGVDAVHVAYRGTPPAITDLMGGIVDFMFLDVSTAMGLAKGGKIKVLASVTPARLPGLPGVPTVQEAGVSDFYTYSWQGIVAPRGTPRKIVDRINAEFRRAVADPAVRQRLLDAGIEPVTSTPEQMAEHAKSETVRWAEVIRKAGIKLE